MAEINYPSSLPAPKTSLISPVEGRALASEQEPLFARAISTEGRMLERITWPALNSARAEALQLWWETDLTYGGAWFNATWPLPQGLVRAVRKFIQPLRWRRIGHRHWMVEAVCEVRRLSLPVREGGASTGGDEIGWFNPVTSASGTVAHANSGTGELSDFAVSGVTTLYAGFVGWVDEALVWSIASWTSGSGHPSPSIADSADDWVQIQWDNTYGGGPPIGDASIGTLILTATVNGNPIAAGERLIAVSSPPTGDYATIAWGPEP